MSSSIKNTNDFYNQFAASPEEEKKILSSAASDLTGTQMEDLKKRIEVKKTKSISSSFVTVPSASVVAPAPISAKALDMFWEEIEKLDPITLLSDDVLNAFKYVGFSPDTIISEVMRRGLAAGCSKRDIQVDLVNMVTISILKGSITENNLKKTSDEGKILYKELQARYSLSTGGTKGKDPTTLTVARVAAALPGMVIKILVKKPAFAKSFVGPFSSKSLPPYLRHQASAACIPSSLSEKLKEYLLGLITAYTSDQSKVLSKTKDSADVVYDQQLNFVVITHGSDHPKEDDRRRIFSGYSLVSDYEKLDLVAKRIKKVRSDFATLTLSELETELAK